MYASGHSDLFVENWLTFGRTAVSQFSFDFRISVSFGTLLPLAVLTGESIVPVMMLSFPILNSTQLSFLRFLTSVRLGLADVRRGESHSML